MVLAGAPSSKSLTKLNPNQVRGFWAAGLFFLPFADETRGKPLPI
jgi:hypothetical protein